MFKFKSVASVAAVVALAGTAAMAQETYTKFGEAGGWSVWKINETGGCMIETTEANGTVVQMGVGAEGNTFGYLAFFAQSGVTLADGATRDIAIDVDGDTFKAKAKGVSSGSSTPGWSGGRVLFDNPLLVSDLSAGKTLTVIQEEGIGSFQIPLTGTAAAMEKGRECLGL